VAEALARGPEEVVGYGHVGARTAAGIRRIDVDVTVVRDVADARLDGIRGEIERAIGARLPEARIVVHLHRPPGPAGPTGEGRRRRKP
jgi:divalent metal cation (Fe/Co/Zn/Cd) transporter